MMQNLWLQYRQSMCCKI